MDPLWIQARAGLGEAEVDFPGFDSLCDSLQKRQNWIFPSPARDCILNGSTRSCNSHKLIKVNRRSSLIDNQLENCFGSDIFTDEIRDESFEYSGELDDDEINTTPLT